MGGVFFLPRPANVHAALEADDIAYDPDADFALAHYVGVHRYDASDDPPETWVAYVEGYLETIGVTVDDRSRSAFGAAFAVPAHTHWNWLRREALEALGRLAALEPAIGVVSNCDGTAARALSDQGVCQEGPGPALEITVIVDSGIVGVQKPDPAIFGPALAAVGCPPDRCIYIGDTVRNDVDGARAAGLHPVLIDPFDLHEGLDADRVSSVGDLVHALASS